MPNSHYSKGKSFTAFRSAAEERGHKARERRCGAREAVLG